VAKPKSSHRLSNMQNSNHNIQTTVACVCPGIKVQMSIIGPVHTSTIQVSLEAIVNSAFEAGWNNPTVVCSNLPVFCLPACADKTNYVRNSNRDQLFRLSCSAIAQYPIQSICCIASSKGSGLDHRNHIASSFDVTNCLVNHH